MINPKKEKLTRSTSAVTPMVGTGVAMRLPEAAAAEAAEAAEASSLSEAEAAEDTAAEAATSSKTLMSDSPENDKIKLCQFISISRKTADVKARLCLDSRLSWDGKVDFCIIVGRNF